MELRVHGIGGPDPNGVLGCPSSRPSVVSWRSEAGSRSVVRACAGHRDVHVYHWSPLTSGSRSFAVWPVLLPFTLVNLAGWMGPAGLRTTRASVHRAAAAWVGLATTAAAMVWLLVAGVVVWQDVTGSSGGAPGVLSNLTFAAAAASAALAMSALVLMATYTASGFERFRPPSWPKQARAWRWPWGAGLSAGLDDPLFHDNENNHKVRWRVHVAVATGTWLVVVVAVAFRSAHHSGHVVGRALVVVGAAQGLGVAAMALAGLLPGGSGRRRLTRRLLAASAASVGIVFLGGLVLSALISVAGIDSIPPGPLALLYDCYGWAALGGLGGAAVCVLHTLITPVAAEAGPARPLLPTLGARMRARLATVLGNIDQVVTSLAAAFALSGALALALRWDEALDDTWRLTATPPVNVARSTFAFVLTFTVLNLWKSRGSPDALKRVGNVWDIVTFWPRAFHPFAVRPYAERAVPELQEFLRAAPRTGRLAVAAHSQGTVLAYAAIQPFLTADGGCSLPPFALVTFGSPLRALYAPVFPCYFDVAHFAATRQALDRRWVNHFRFTDHVGRAVFASDAEVAASFGGAAPSADRPMADAVLPDRQVHGHNDYWPEPAIRAAVASGETTAPSPA